MAKKLEAEKQLATKKKKEAELSTEAPAPVSSHKLPEGNPTGSIMAKKSESQAALATLSKKSLHPIVEKDESQQSADSTVSTKEDDTALNDPVPKPMAFGSPTAKPMTFGVPTAKSVQSEPDCPKPSSFGASTPSGAAGTSPAFGGAVVNSEQKGSAFLNLQPPGSLSSTPSKFVFGKSANITLTVPSSKPLASQTSFGSFGQTAKFGTTPFGGGGFGGGTTAFGTTSFEGADAAKKSPFGSDEKGQEPATCQSPEEEGEIVDDTENTK